LKLFDTLLGRTRQAQPDLERLFRLPSAAMTLQSAYGLCSTGQAGVCYKREAGRAFAESQQEFRQLLGLGDGPDAAAVSVHEEADNYGYSWVVIDCSDFERLVNMVHVVNGTLGDEGFGAKLLLSVFAFGADVVAPALLDDGLGNDVLADSAPVGTWSSASPIYVVYLYKRGTFYPFVPTGGERQDVQASLVLADALADDLVIEKDLENRFPIWGVPVH
jgi:hypothetical protein